MPVRSQTLLRRFARWASSSWTSFMHAYRVHHEYRGLRRCGVSPQLGQRLAELYVETLEAARRRSSAPALNGSMPMGSLPGETTRALSGSTAGRSSLDTQVLLMFSASFPPDGSSR